MYEFLRAILAFVFVLGVLVFIHELGHYLAARWRGIHVDVFSIGFGQPLYRWHDKTGTEWRISAIPLGGYVKPHGFEGPEEANPEQKSSWIPGKTFHEKPVSSRAIVTVAGPVFNFLLAIILFTGLFAVSGRILVKPLVQDTLPNSAAAQAGLKPNDLILKLDNIENPDVQKVIDFAHTHPGYSTNLVIKRQEKEITLPITVGQTIQNGKAVGQLGIAMGGVVAMSKPLPLGKSIIVATQETWNLSVQTLVGLGEVISGKRSAKELGGPLRIAQISGEVAQGGFSKLVFFMGLLSVNLGLINLLPIPVLDGGRLLFYGIEAVLGRPVNRKVQEWVFTASFALIFLLFLIVTFNDASSMGLFRWLTGHTH